MQILMFSHKYFRTLVLPWNICSYLYPYSVKHSPKFGVFMGSFRFQLRCWLISASLLFAVCYKERDSRVPSPFCTNLLTGTAVVPRMRGGNNSHWEIVETWKFSPKTVQSQSQMKIRRRVHDQKKKWYFAKQHIFSSSSVPPRSVVVTVCESQLLFWVFGKMAE